MATLYKISTALEAILNTLEENGGEITPEIEQALTITEGQFAAKAEDYGRAIINLKAMAKAAKDEKDRLSNLQKYYENTYKRLQDIIVNAMQAFGKDKIDNPTMHLSLKHTQAVADDYDISLIPRAYKNIKVEEIPDKNAIKATILSNAKAAKDSGEEPADPTIMGAYIPGVRLTENVSLQIK